MHEIAPEVNATARVEARDVIVPGDMLAINFAAYEELGQPDLAQNLPVQKDGTVSIMGVGAVQAAGQTPEQLTRSLVDAYRQLMGSQPIMAVAIAQPAPRGVHVLGAVKRPGRLELTPDRRLTLVEALAEVGGTAWGSSYLANTLLVRWDHQEQRQVAWKIDAREKWWGEQEAIFLQPNDLIYIPDTPVVKVATVIDLYIAEMIPFPSTLVTAGTY